MQSACAVGINCSLQLSVSGGDLVPIVEPGVVFLRNTVLGKHGGVWESDQFE